HVRADHERPGQRHVAGAEVEIARRRPGRRRQRDRAVQGAAAARAAERVGDDRARAAGADRADGDRCPAGTEHARRREERDREAACQRHGPPTRQSAARLPPPSRTRAPRTSMPPRSPVASLAETVRSAPTARRPRPRFLLATAPLIRPCEMRARIPCPPFAVATAASSAWPRPRTWSPSRAFPAASLPAVPPIAASCPEKRKP